MGLEPWNDEDAGPLSGVYAAQSVVDATVAGMVVSLRMVFRLRLLQTGAMTKQSNTLCSFKLPTSPLASLVIPPALQTIIQQQSVVVAEGPFLSSAGEYSPPPFLIVLGAKLDNPATDPLPTMANLNGEWDEDHDGHPGVTIDATVFLCTSTQQLYVALRTGGTLTGMVTGPGTIDGTMALFETESVLGYSNKCLAAAADITPKLSPSSPYHAKRVADEAQLRSSGNIDCAEIVARAPALFGDAGD
jgi:hypothetical protein